MGEAFLGVVGRDVRIGNLRLRCFEYTGLGREDGGMDGVADCNLQGSLFIVID